MLGGFWDPFEAALGAAGGLTRKTVRAAIEARLDGFLFGPGGGGGDGADPRRRRCPECGKDSLELKLSRYGPFVGCAEYPDCGYRRSLSAAAAQDGGYAGPRELGSDPDSALAVTLRRGPTGWYVQRGERAGTQKPGRMSLPPALVPQDVDLDTALRLLALPRRVGLHPETGEPILAGIGRYGPWVRHAGTYAAIPGDEDVLAVGINRAVALIADKEIRQSRVRGPNTVLRELGRHPGDGAPVRLKTGHYGPFVAHRCRYASLPKNLAPEDVTLDAAVALLVRAPGGYPAVVIPVLTQHYAMLKRNLLYTGVTRGKRLVVLVGQKKAVAIAVRNASGRRRWSKLDEWLAGAEDGRGHGIAEGARSPQGSPLTGAMPYG